LSAIGPGDLVTNSAAGATYGYTLIWVLGISLVFRAAWLSVSAKYVLVTGESLIQGYARVGRWLVWTVFVAALLIGHLSNLYMIVFIGNAAHMLLPLPFSWSAALWSVFFVAVGFLLIFRGGYRGVERVCQGLVVVLGASLLGAALMSRPDPQAIVKGMLIPSLPFSDGLYSTILILTAIIGTEAGSLTNIIYAYFIYEKRWTKPVFLRRQRLDLVFSIACIFFMGALIQIAAAGTLNKLGIDFESVQDLGVIYAETQGNVGLIIFAVGFWALAFSSFVGLTMGKALIVEDIYYRFISRNNGKTGTDYSRKQSLAFRVTIAFYVFTPLWILFVDAQPVLLTLVVSSLLLVATPVLAYGLLRFTNDREIMGDYRNRWYTNAVLCLLILVAVFISYRNGLELWGTLKSLFL
jgi:Mn2+/Fe2+ NRAMP family transporter